MPQFFEQCDIVTAFSPADLNSDADGDWVNLENHASCVVVVAKAAGTAGDDISLKLNQAKDVAGTGAKALDFTTLWHKIGTQSAVGQWTRLAFAATNDLDTGATGVTPGDLQGDNVAALFAIEVPAAALDIANGYRCLQVQVEGDDLSNACVGCGFYLLYGARYTQPIPLNAIV